MKNISKILWGVALIVAGIIFALNAFGVTNINLFFDGWWTLFIIIPCFIGLFTDKDKVGNAIGLAIGVVLLLCCQDVFGFDMIWKIIVPIIIIALGLKLILGGVFQGKTAKILEVSRKNGENVKVGCAVFSSQDIKFDDEVFYGAELTAVFGAVKCDLRNAIFEKDCALSVTAIFGGAEIYLPDTVNVKINSNSVFGGVDKKEDHSAIENAITVYINATCVFGGVEIK